jgi:Mn-dependent DtxR family transcriptional regulator
MSEQPFFLPTRKLAQFLDTSQPTAAAAMRILRSMGVLIMSAEHTRTQSPRYHVAPEYLGGGIASR